MPGGTAQAAQVPDLTTIFYRLLPGVSPSESIVLPWPERAKGKRAERNDMAATCLCNSSIRGCHVYQSVWSAEEEEPRVQAGDA